MSYWVALEGIDGSGKSTQAELLASALKARLTREPGGTAFGAELRHILLNTDTDITVRAEALLFAADRAQHLFDVVQPALSCGTPVVSDRSVWSSVAYQGTRRGLDVAELVQVNGFALNNVWPDIVVYIDVPVEVAIDRRSGQSCDRIESQGAELQNAARSRYLQIADERPEWLVIDGLQAAADVFDQVFHQVSDRLRKS